MQTGITAIRCRLVKDGGAFPTVEVQGNVTYTEPGAVDRYYMQLASIYEKESRYSVNQRTANETRPSNVSLFFGIYLGSSSEV